jgi:hypothetical protein
MGHQLIEAHGVFKKITERDTRYKNKNRVLHLNFNDNNNNNPI